MDRRRFWLSGILTAVFAVVLWGLLQSAGLPFWSSPHPQNVPNQDASKKAGEKPMTPPVKIPDEELKKRLTPMQYQVTQHKATEPAFTGEYWNSHDAGLYRCVVCRHAPLPQRRQVRFGVRMAKLLQARGSGCRGGAGRQDLHDGER